MKKIIYGLFLFSSFSAYSAQVKSDSFDVSLELNKYSEEKSFNIKVQGSCEAYSILGDTSCSVENNKILAKKISQNSFNVPGFKFKSKTDGLLVSSYVMNTSVLLENGKNMVTLFADSSEKNSHDLSKNISGYFRSPVFITTIPAFSFETQGILISSKVKNSRLKKINTQVTYNLLNSSGEVINQVKWNKYSYDGVHYDSKHENDVVKTIVQEKMYATKQKPKSLKVEISFNVSYFGKNKIIKKDYVFDNLDDLDMANKISEIELEIIDENIE